MGDMSQWNEDGYLWLRTVIFREKFHKRIFHKSPRMKSNVSGKNVLTSPRVI